MTRLSHLLALMIATVGGIVLVGACGVTGHDRSGDPGRIVEKDRDTRTVNKVTTTDYDFTIERADGTRYELDVSGTAFEKCYVGSAYPSCLER
ncbi:hypothetical protein [Streptomyces sp. S1]|uniref:hypothetical protein n=1 Tax=Streptomyces sp. S1 TaxID=718288 RepID=UPI003D717927